MLGLLVHLSHSTSFGRCGHTAAVPFSPLQIETPEKIPKIPTRTGSDTHSIGTRLRVGSFQKGIRQKR